MKRYLILLVATILQSHASFASDEALNNDSSGLKKSLKNFPIPILGGGFSDDMQIPMGISCLQQGQIQYDGGTKSVISLGKSYNFDEIQQQLNVNVSADANIGMFSADASTDYAKYVQNTDYSESFFFLEKIILPTKIFTPAGFGQSGLSPFGQMAYSAGPDQFRLSCGNKFYQQESLGANFFTTFKVVFNSTYDKSNFDASVGASGGISDFFSASTSIQNIVQQNNIHGALEISAYQEGGDPTQLAQIFSKCTDHYCVTSCDLNNLSACQGTMDGIINYTQNNFPGQIDFKDGQVQGTANPLSFSYMDYAQLGLNVGSSTLTPDIIAARQYLGGVYKDTLNNEAIVDHILNSKVSASIVASYKAKLQALSSTLHDNAALLDDSNNGAVACYLKPSSCLDIRKQIDSELKPIDMDTLNIFKVGYIDRSQSGPYLVIPVGGNQYQSYNLGGANFTSQQTMTLSSDGNTLHVDGIDIGNHHFIGDFAKVGDGTFSGQLRYDMGLVNQHQFSMVENPS